MAYRNKYISNPYTGQDIKFIQTAKDTGGDLLEMETTYQSKSTEPVPHYHPLQAEDFSVLTGELTVKINGEIRQLKAGDRLHLPANTVHAMWNNSDGMTVVNWKVQPALQTEYLLETGMGLARDGKTNKTGMPGLLQVALMANQFSGEFRLTRPPYIVQKLIFLFLTPFSYLFGYRPTYKKYLD